MSRLPREPRTLRQIRADAWTQERRDHRHRAAMAASWAAGRRSARGFTDEQRAKAAATRKRQAAEGRAAAVTG